MSAIIAIKPLRYEGKEYEPGQVLTPPPSGRLRDQLVRGRLCEERATPPRKSTSKRTP